MPCGFCTFLERGYLSYRLSESLEHLDQFLPCCCVSEHADIEDIYKEGLASLEKCLADVW